MKTDMNSIYTYVQKKSCLHCEKPIPDQAHAATKFCQRHVLPDGSIQSCHDDFHFLIRKEREEPFKKIVDHHKKMSQQIELLFSTKGENVTLEDINQFGIKLNSPVKLSVDNKRNFTYYFVDFIIHQITTTHFKISTHETNV